MAINTSDLLLNTKPLSPLNLDIGGGGGMSLERQRLKLMREQFENTKRQQEQQAELGRLEESGRMARERMQNERAVQQAEAAKQAELQRQRVAAHSEFAKLAGSGDVRGAEALVPLMSNLGMSVDRLGQENGLPTYLIDMSEEDKQKRLASEAAAQSAEAPAPGVASTEDAFRAAQQATRGEDPTLEERRPDMSFEELGRSKILPGQMPLPPSHFQETGQPMREPAASAIDTRNVMNMGAMAAETRSRLDPVMSGLVAAYPQEQRQSARSTADAMLASGLPDQEAIKEFRAQRGGPDSAANSETVARAQGGNQAYSRRKEGFDQAQQTFKGAELDKSLGSVESAGQIREILTNDNREDDIQVMNLIVGLSGGKGTQSDKDIARAMGLPSTGTIDNFVNYLETKFGGGFGENQRTGLLSYVDSAERRQKNRVFSWMDNVDQDAKKPGSDPDEASGAVKFRDYQIPRALRQEYEGLKKKPKGSAAQGSSFNMERDSKSENPKFSMQDSDTGGLNPEALAGVIQAESGGNPGARNASGATGLIQFMPSIAESMGTTTDAIAKMSAAEQMPLVVKYLKDRGINEKSSQGDMYVAIAAGAFVGEPDDTVVYKKGSKAWEQNALWRPKDGGDITVGSIKAYGGGAQRGESPPADSLDAKRARLAELRAKAGMQ